MTTKTEEQMTTYGACALIEGFADHEATEDEIIAAYQHLIDTGLVWKLQGFYGRTAMALIDAGLCTAGAR